MPLHRLAIFLIASLVTAQAPTNNARHALDLLLSEKYSDLLPLFTPEMQAGLTETVMRDRLGPQIKSFGQVEKIGEPKVTKSGAFEVYVFPVQFANHTFNFELAIDATQQIAGLHMTPALEAWRSASYDNPGSYREREVTIGSDAWKLPGTLTEPIGKGPFPGIVLVHGSGPNDRDETISAIKVFKDLAQGLVSRGFAVLRYEKRTKVYGAQMKSLGGLTVAQETVDDAVRAVGLLRIQPEIDPRHVFVIGHSLGGYVGPRIARQDGKLAGLIIMAGSVQPLEDIILEQNIAAGADEKQLDAVQQQVRAIKQLDPSKDNPETLFGLPASYFLDLRGYSPVTTARTLGIPVLILQGERDFQVTMKDFELWKTGLASQKRVTLHSYPGLSHLFVMGEGKGSLAEYSTPGHVSTRVIEDIATWIRTSL